MIHLKDNRKLKKVLGNIGGSLFILLAPELLSPLYIASYKHWRDCQDCEKERKRLTKKLVKINYRLTGVEVSGDAKKIFYEVCKQIDFLSLKELKTLRAFCNVIDKQDGLDLRMHRDIDEIVEIVSKYKNSIDEYIDSKKEKINVKI